MRFRPRFRLHPAPVLVLAAGTTAALAATGHAPGATGACAADLHHAAVVVEHGNNSSISRCVGFDTGSIKGEDLLRDAGITFAVATYGSLGDALCQVDSEPQTYPPGCWTADSPYWAMFVSRSGGAWTTAGSGISAETFGPGDALGLRYESQASTLYPPSAQDACSSPSSPTPASVAASTPTAATSRNVAAPSPSASSPAAAAPAPTPPAPAPSLKTASARTANTPISPGWIAIATVGGVLLSTTVMRVARRRGQSDV